MCKKGAMEKLATFFCAVELENGFGERAFKDLLQENQGHILSLDHKVTWKVACGCCSLLFNYKHGCCSLLFNCKHVFGFFVDAECSRTKKNLTF